MAARGDGDHQKHRCSCNTDSTARRSSLEPISKLGAYDTDVEPILQGKNSVSVSTIPFDQTSGT